MTALSLPRHLRSKSVTAILGPTNTGKTHLAIERMCNYGSGLIGLPLRLLAREVFDKLVERKGPDVVALITGEEKIIPRSPRYWVSTVEAMPKDLVVDFLAIDEVQLAGNLDRGHVFTDRILNSRGREETLLLGSLTVRPLLERLLPGLNIVTRPRMSVLSYAGSKKITRLPRRSAIVAFSSNEVYAIAELIRRQNGGAAVVLGSLSPRTRNAQVELYQNGDVDWLVATDAIGMGLNLDVDHIAFAGHRKFDGYQYRQLTPSETGQIAGRAGRHLRDGTFGVTGRVAGFDDDLVHQLESHSFDALKVLQWRNCKLDFASIQALLRALEHSPQEQGLTKAPPAEDIGVLELAGRNHSIASVATTRERVELLWDVCQVPDYRKIAPANHAELVFDLYSHLTSKGKIPEEWLNKQIAFADRTDGDIDTLANRIAHIRTWTFVANRAEWLSDPTHWQELTRGIEDRLSDALHERLTQRFVDRRTSVLMRRLRENKMLEAEITATGDVLVEGQHIGQLHGFRFAPDTAAEGQDEKAVRTAAQKALASEIEARADRVAAAPNEEFALAADGAIRWQGAIIARLVAGEATLRPGLIILADEQLSGPAREKVQQRIDQWLNNHIETLLKPLFDLEKAEELEGLGRGIAFQLHENLGILERAQVADDVRQLDQTMRGALRKLGVRFGAYHIFVPLLLKPAPSQLMAQLWALKEGKQDAKGLDVLPQLSASGRTSVPHDAEIEHALYKVVGFRVCGPRAVRVDILERLADIIRPLVAWKPLDSDVEAPEGVWPEGGAFTVTVSMTSLLGCAGEDFSNVLKSLGYRAEEKQVERPIVAAKPAEEEAPVTAAEETTPAETAAAETASEETASADEPAEATTTEEAPASGEAQTEMVTIEVWRPGRMDRRRQGGDNQRRGNNRGGKRPQQDGERRHSKGSPRRGGNNKAGGHKPRGGNSAPARDKPIDPNSPFAALMSLKNGMKDDKS
ncbi:DEAD/DEAH box helicase [Polycladidibacter hongkongensis]|uniref:DEAD/DEAH box helicase n=1 Tax=Polycladidibacter hongkongensis TaxID=1647556 RepID=UPI0008333967|nr:DEAD/DEAH box helicase [Pseudovibrio hongkongensis]